MNIKPKKDVIKAKAEMNKKEMKNQETISSTNKEKKKLNANMGTINLHLFVRKLKYCL